jgi:hypothetical protein
VFLWVTLFLSEHSVASCPLAISDFAVREAGDFQTSFSRQGTQPFPDIRAARYGHLTVRVFRREQLLASRAVQEGDST